MRRGESGEKPTFGGFFVQMGPVCYQTGPEMPEI